MHHGTQSTNLKALKISATLTFIYFFVEIIVALITGSLSLLADAAHELSTVIAISISLVAGRLALTRPTTQRTFGLLRAETLAAFINGLLLLGMAMFIIINGVNRLANPIEMEAGPMLAVALGGIGLDAASLIVLYKGQKGNLNMRGSFWHVMNDFLGTLAVIIAALFIQFGQIFSVDTWAGLLFALILIYAAFGIIRDASKVLTDQAPEDVDLAKIEKDLMEIGEIKSMHHVHARTITSGINTFSAHIVVYKKANAHPLLTHIKQIVEGKYKFSLSTVQLEEENLNENDPKQIEYKDSVKEHTDGHK